MIVQAFLLIGISLSAGLESKEKASSEGDVFTRQRSLYGEAFTAAFDAQGDGAFILRGDLKSGVLLGARPNGEAAVLVVTEFASDVDHGSLHQVNGVLLGTAGEVPVSAWIVSVPSRGYNSEWVVIPTVQGDSLLDVAEPASLLKEDQPDCQSYWNSRDCDSYGACMAGPEPDCASAPDPDTPGIQECMRAAMCRFKKCQWAVEMSNFACRCRNSRPGSSGPSTGVRLLCAAMYSPSLTACQLVLTAELLTCVPIGAIKDVASD